GSRARARVPLRTDRRAQRARRDRRLRRGPARGRDPARTPRRLRGADAARRGRARRVLLAARARRGGGGHSRRAPARDRGRRPLALLGDPGRVRRRGAPLPRRSSTVALFVLIGRDGAQGAALRPRMREAHLANLKPLADAGRVVHAGPMLDDAGAPCGSVVVFEAPDLASARAFAASDPYVVEGVFESWEVRETRRVFPAD